ncbi:hypothetical protein [Pseudomonas sp.]|uniref:hypothetical protein n=1 Tax=Pseudomonas sp. TaxID=306 RepID=UPI0028AC4F70|nr:hypothetical protein [Pseudomonas sp.]
MHKRLTLSALLLLFAHTAIDAAPAPFYLWQSKLTGRYQCSQHQPGEGWVWHAGPFNNAGCRNR